MKLHFLGGANEVGASCTLLEVAGKRILVDAGMRMQKREGSSLPDLSRLQELGKPDAILLTHAHTDHIGALPLVYLGFPGVPIYTTPPTKALSQVLLQDSLRIMESRWEQEEEIPLYPPHAVEGMLGRMVMVHPGQPVAIADGVLQATYIPSGHVLGACSITLETPEGTILFAGDYSVDRQQTVEGMTLPTVQPDLMITESTYGNRIHSNRRQEEDRLCKAVAEVVQARGKVLIPSFALGRAQEVILLLLDAQRRGHIPKFPIRVDGMVKTMCAVYSHFPEYLRESLRRWIEANGNPFFHPEGAQTVLANKREEVVKGPPCAIVASSGMLTGGASRYYAEQLVDHPKNAIFITGYQDEESPGRQLLDLAQEVQSKGEGMLRLGGQARRVLCRVERYGLSAHADASQMLNVICRIKPKHVVLVHGDDEARGAFAQTFPPDMQVHLPGNSQTLEFAPFRASRAFAQKVIQAALAEPDSPLDLEKLSSYLAQKNGAQRLYTLQELAQTWFGQATSEQLESLRQAVAAAPQLFAPDRNRPFLYRVVSVSGKKPVAPALTKSFAARPEGKKSEASQVLKLIKARFEQLRDFETAAPQPQLRLVTLHFSFPDRAALVYQEQLRQLALDTGWAVELSSRVSHKALNIAVKESVPLSWDVGKISIFPKENLVRVNVRPIPQTTEADFEAAKERFYALTLHKLELERMPETPLPQSLFDERGRMEQNAAYNHLRKKFAELGLALLSFSRRDDHLELGLINPKLLDSHPGLLEQLSTEIGWKLVLRSSLNQNAIGVRLRQLMPIDWLTKAEPAIHENVVRHRIEVTPEKRPLWSSISEQFFRETGLQLAVKE